MGEMVNNNERIWGLDKRYREGREGGENEYCIGTNLVNFKYHDCIFIAVSWIDTGCLSLPYHTHFMVEHIIKCAISLLINSAEICQVLNPDEISINDVSLSRFQNLDLSFIA